MPLSVLLSLLRYEDRNSSYEIRKEIIWYRCGATEDAEDMATRTPSNASGRRKDFTGESSITMTGSLHGNQ